MMRDQQQHSYQNSPAFHAKRDIETGHLDESSKYLGKMLPSLLVHRTLCSVETSTLHL